MPSNLPRLVTRVTNDTHNKFIIISNNEKRTVSKQLELLIENFINDYEKSNGAINLKQVNILNQNNGDVNINN